MICNRSELADMIGCARTSIDSWVVEGAPVISKPGRKGVESQYDSAAFIRWLIDREKAKASKRADAGDLDALRGEKIRVETKLRELQLAREAGQLAPLEQVERAAAAAMASIRGPLLALPQRAAIAIVGETDSNKIVQMLRAEVYSALNQGADALDAAMNEFEEEETDGEC